MHKEEIYASVQDRLGGILEGETDAIAMMATIACELKTAFPEFSWVGFYRVVRPDMLKVGPYQGGHGCLEIAFSRGVCGQCAREGKTQIAEDVRLLPHHIACSEKTKSEIVVPVRDGAGRLVAVLDIDSEKLGQFDDADREHLERICLFFTKNSSPPTPPHDTI